MQLVSIIIPCYNQAAFIGKTLDNVLRQDYTNWECLIVNDGSTDDSMSVIAKYLHKDQRFRCFDRPNQGVSAARNFGLDQAAGDFIQFLDADDLIAEDKLSKAIGIFEQTSVDVVCSNYVQFSETIANSLGTFSQLKDYDFSFENIARFWNGGFTIPIHCFIFKRTIINKLRFPVGLSAQEDWTLWLQIYEQNPTTYYLDEVQAFYRSNPMGRTQTSGFFNETLLALKYLKIKLKEDNFILLYESVIKRYYESVNYWRKREMLLKQSNTYQFGLFCKKIGSKLHFLPLARKVFGLILKFKAK
jgi:glycosyltransferase involved in cell wall biosynthesis